MKKFFSNKSTNFLKGLRLYLLSSFLIIAYSCDEKSEDVVPNNDFLLVENASSDFSNMLSFSFDGLNNIDLENVDIETQVL